MTAALAEAMRRGVAGLVGRQQPDGSFPLLAGSPARGWQPCGRLFSTAYVVLVAGRLLPAESAAAARQFIRSRRRPDRLWEYDPVLGIPPDADSTACSLGALADDGRADELADGARLLRGFWRPDAGPFRTWSAPGIWSLPEREDPVVNGNILAALRRLGSPPTAAEAAAALALCARSQGQSRYYCGPAAVAHAAHLGGLPLPALPKTALERPPPTDLLACVQWLAATGERDDALVAAVLEAQRPDGAWPIRPWVTGQAMPFWASAAVTTALALEALSRLAAG